MGKPRTPGGGLKAKAPSLRKDRNKGTQRTRKLSTGKALWMLRQWEGTLRGARGSRRRIEGAKPGAVKAASPVLNGGDEETGLDRPRLVATQLGAYTGMQWKCLPVPKDSNGTPAIHSTTVYNVFAKWADDGSLWQAFIASVRHLAAAKYLDTSVLHGDGTNTVAKKGGMGSGTRATNTRRARRSLPSSTIMALCELPSPWLP